MAENDFDFDELKGLKIAQYKKTHLKPALFKKCKAAIIFTDYKMAGKKTPCVVVPFKKGAIAAKSFKSVKKNKEHLLKKTGLAALTFNNTEDGKTIVKIEIKKGGLSPDILATKAAKLFGEIKMEFEVVGQGGAETVSEDSPAVETPTEETPQENVSVVDEIKGLIKGISATMKDTILANVVPNVKSKEVTEEDLESSSGVLIDIERLGELYESAEERVKNALAKHVEKINSYKPKIEKIKGAIEKILPTLSDVVDAVTDTIGNVADAVSDTMNSAFDAVSESVSEAFNALDGEVVEEPVELPEDPAVQALRDMLEGAGNTMKDWYNDLDSIESSLGQSIQESEIPEGADMLNDLF